MRVPVFAILLALLAQPCSAGTNPYLIALMGQSNMVGSGELSDLPPGFPVNPTKLWNFTNAYKWEPAKEPIDSPLDQLDLVSLDKRAGVGPSLALADAFVSLHPTTTVGLIPCAKGGSSISDWQKTDKTDQRSTLYGSCMTRMKMVSPANGTIRAVIFWQGGADAKNEKDALKWKERFGTFVADLRRDLGNPNLPIVVVMLALHNKEAVKQHPYWQVVREQQRAVNIPGVVKFDSDGYERQVDGVHFTARGQLALGAALAYLLPAP
jgi:Carbohydrate esterase, sialic acid-specific acetylesterase